MLESSVPVYVPGVELVVGVGNVVHVFAPAGEY
jgi:hypothetical protein